MTKTIFIASLIATVAIAVSLTTRNRAQARLLENDATLHQQEIRLAELASENSKLSNLLAQAEAGVGAASNVTDSAELARLRDKAESLRRESGELAAQWSQSRRAAGATALSQGDYNLLDHNHEKTIAFSGGPREAGKLNDARAFGAAIQEYAHEHDGQLPSDLSQLTAYLPKPLDSNSPPWANAPLSGTNDFELLFQGTQGDLTNIPPRRVALLRERQPWQEPDGKWARVYGYADGAASLVESDDNFQTWDAQHIVPTQASSH